MIRNSLTLIFIRLTDALCYSVYVCVHALCPDVIPSHRSRFLPVTTGWWRIVSAGSLRLRTICTRKRQSQLYKSKEHEPRVGVVLTSPQYFVFTAAITQPRCLWKCKEEKDMHRKKQNNCDWTPVHGFKVCSIEVNLIVVNASIKSHLIAPLLKKKLSYKSTLMIIFKIK